MGHMIWLSNPFLDDIKLIFKLLELFTVEFFRTLQYSAEFQINIYHEFQNMLYEVESIQSSFDLKYGPYNMDHIILSQEKAFCCKLKSFETHLSRF